MGFPHGSIGKESACNAGDPRSVLELGRSPGEGNGYPLQYSCLEDSMVRGAWRAMLLGQGSNLCPLHCKCSVLTHWIIREVPPGVFLYPQL